MPVPPPVQSPELLRRRGLRSERALASGELVRVLLRGGTAPLPIFSLPFSDWCLLRVYPLSPSAIGACYGYIPSDGRRAAAQPFACVIAYSAAYFQVLEENENFR
eukprot:1189893-Prorocentrum_minimum.AAC.1